MNYEFSIMNYEFSIMNYEFSIMNYEFSIPNPHLSSGQNSGLSSEAPQSPSVQSTHQRLTYRTVPSIGS